MPRIDKIASPLTLAFVLAAAPVAAQAQPGPVDSANPANPMTTSPATPAGPGPATPGMSQPDTTDVPASEPAMEPQAQAQTPDATGNPQVAAFVDQQFNQADANGDGVLTPDEFEPWMAQLKTAENEAAGQTADTSEAQTYASNAFSAADVDGDGRISKVELTQFLSA